MNLEFSFPAQQQSLQPSNIILIRGARTENGQIILQNGHDLLSLLNSGAVSVAASSEDDKRTCNTSNSPSVLLHRKAASLTNISTTPKLSHESNKFVIQSTLKNPATITQSQIADAAAAATLNGGNGNAVLHSIQTLKNTTSANALTTSSPSGTTNIPEGSIIFQQRINKNGDGPILLQTLKRIDKSPSILLFRNNATAAAAGNQNVVKTKSINNQITVLANNKDNDKSEPMLKTKSTSSNVPLGAGKSFCDFILKYILSLLELPLMLGSERFVEFT